MSRVEQVGREESVARLDGGVDLLQPSIDEITTWEFLFGREESVARLDGGVDLLQPSTEITPWEFLFGREESVARLDGGVYLLQPSTEITPWEFLHQLGQIHPLYMSFVKIHGEVVPLFHGVRVAETWSLNSTQVNLLHSHPVPADTTLSQGSSNLPPSINEDPVTVEIPQPAVEGKTTPATAISKVMVLINRTEAIPKEVLIGLIGAASQSLINLSTSMPNGITRNVLTASNGLGFLFLLSGMLRRARNCNHANLIIFLGVILTAAGTILSMPICMPGLFSWLASIISLFTLITAMFY